MTPVGRDRLIIGAAAALAIVVPAILLWPAPADIHEQPAAIVTQLPSTDFAFANAVATAPPFSPTRTIEEETPGDALANLADAAPIAAAAPPPVLVGIALARAGGVALVKTAAGDTVQARVGEVVDGWRVAAIGRDAITLDQGGQRMALRLEFGTKPPPARNSAPDAAIGERPQIPLPPPEGARP